MTKKIIDLKTLQHQYIHLRKKVIMSTDLSIAQEEGRGISFRFLIVRLSTCRKEI